MSDAPGRIRFTPRYPKFTPTHVRGRATSPLDELYHFVLTRSWIVLLALLCSAFVAVNVVFAWLYTLAPDAIAGARPGSFEDAFYFSVQTMTTIGYGGMVPQTRAAHLLVTVEAMLGILGTALVMGLTFARFARPTARVLFSHRAVIAARDGAPHLTHLRVVLIVLETTREGQQLRRAIELPLVHERTPVFSLTWTVMHPIDAHSPFHGEPALQRLRSAGGELFLTMQGIDDTFNSEVRARHRYRIDDVVAGARFADVLTVHRDGTREIDYRNFHELVPAPLERAP